MPKDQTQQQEVSPNLPTEEEQLTAAILKFDLERAKSTRNYIKGLITEQEAEASLEQGLEDLLDVIHHYATKRELEVRIDEAYTVKHLLNTSHHDLPIGTPASYTAGVIEQRVVELKAQKEQEIVWRNIAT